MEYCSTIAILFRMVILWGLFEWFFDWQRTIGRMLDCLSSFSMPKHDWTCHLHNFIHVGFPLEIIHTGACVQACTYMHFILKFSRNFTRVNYKVLCFWNNLYSILTTIMFLYWKVPCIYICLLLYNYISSK